jgi:ribosomal protein S18 acetylase RimI-like enzyme
MEHLVIRTATLEDNHLIADLECKIFPDNCFNEKTIADTLKAGGGLIAENLDTPFGYAVYKLDDNMVDVLRLGVLPQARRLGVGEALLQECMKLNDYTMLTVSQENQPAISLYRKLGFQIAGWIPSHGSWVMRTFS